MKTHWRSIATWPDTIKVGHIVGKNESDDTHDSKEAAEAVCDLLQKHGFGGDGKVFPIATRVEEVTPPPPPPNPLQCPNCSSTNLSGLMASFWVKLNEDGEPAGQWQDYEGDTDLTDAYLCRDCSHEF